MVGVVLVSHSEKLVQGLQELVGQLSSGQVPRLYHSTAVLLPAGAYAGFVHVRHLHLLTGSPYGRTLVVKLGLVGVLLTLGATNHFGHVPAMGRGDPEAEARLVRAVRLEVVVAAVVLAVTALLGVLPMPHAHAS